MRIASRHMPKVTRQPVGVGVWAFLVALGAGLLYFVVSAPKAALGLLGAGVLLACLGQFELKRDRRALLALAEQRKGQTIGDFAKAFDVRAVDPWIIRAVYEQIQQQLSHVHPAFPVHADDRLEEDLRLDQGDLDNCLAPEVEERTGRSMANSEHNALFGRVRTVGDLVYFFQAQPKA